MGAPIKVFYCITAGVSSSSMPRAGGAGGDTSGAYTPYLLHVVPKEFVEHTHVEHYTVTSSGVTFVSGQLGGGGEFVALGDWMRDASVFTLMRQMRFFKDYLIAKTFTFWRSNVRYKMYALVRAKIEKVRAFPNHHVPPLRLLVRD